MRSASFFILSVSLHAAALVYPVSFGGRSQAQLIHVTILPMQQESGGSGSKGTGIHDPTPVRSQSIPRPTSNVHPRAESRPTDDSRQQTLPGEAVTRANDGNVSLVPSPANTTATSNSLVSEATSQSDSNSVIGMSGAGSGGNGVGSSGAGSGRRKGNGSGAGAGSGEQGITLTQARYRDTPKPDYPDSARREGREGRVLLRVLVDDQGRSKQVEINSTSGSDALDRAAAEAIKRWRFHPARYGDQPVESWLRIPIEFRLADAKPR
jgi:protein TonB